MKKIAGIVLAAGGSSRFGKPKQLLTWGNSNIVNATVRTAILAGLDPVIVVLGAFDTLIAATLPSIGLQVVKNHDWETGQSSSLKAGVQVLPVDCDGVLFLLADQPQVNAHLIDALLFEANLGAQAVAPMIDGRRANPVYFRRDVFPLLNTVTGDQGGKAVMREVSVKYVDWLDETQALDIDNPEDYESLHRIYFGEEGRIDKV